MRPSINPPLRTIKSYVIRQGRMTVSQKRAFETLFSSYASRQEDHIPFPQLFSEIRPLNLEIGFGMGQALMHYAQQYPEEHWIGIEVHPPGIGAVLQLIHQYQLQNVRLIQGDALEVLKTQCEDHSLQRVNIFFPDPWPKKRHHKRRLIQASCIQLLAKKIKKGGLLHIATDWAPYAEHIEQCLSSHPEFETINIVKHDRPLTKFEQRGMRLGHAVFDFQWVRM